MADLLIAYYYRRPYPPRASVYDHLASFGRYAQGHRCFYYNLGIAPPPRWLSSRRFDAVIFHTTLLCCRWSPPRFEWLMRRAAPLSKVGAVRAAIPQDEFVYSDLLCEFIRRFDVSRVFTPAPPSEWPKIYRDVDRHRVRFFPVLTGYLDDRTLARIERLAPSGGERTIDIGYRATEARPWLGRQSLLKSEIARVFEAACRDTAWRTDISTRAEDTLLGDAWYRFLLACRYTLGVEGGASILDRDGQIRHRTEAYLARHPAAQFDEVEAACFPGVDGNLALRALSPRHLEACATRTCQILVEGDYNGVLEAGKHYLPLRPDFSNLADVLDALGDERLRQSIVERAYHDVVASGRYGYRNFVREVIDATLEDVPLGTAAGATPLRPAGGWQWRAARAWDRVAWAVVAGLSVAASLVDWWRRRRRPTCADSPCRQTGPLVSGGGSPLARRLDAAHPNQGHLAERPSTTTAATADDTASHGPA